MFRERVGQASVSVPQDVRVLDTLGEVGGFHELEVDMEEGRPDERDDQAGFTDVLPGESGHQSGPCADRASRSFMTESNASSSMTTIRSTSE